METARVKIFAIRKGDACVEWFKTPYLDDIAFEEARVRYNDKSFYEQLLQLFYEWERIGRPNRWRSYPNRLIAEELGFLRYIDEISPGLEIVNLADDRF